MLDSVDLLFDGCGDRVGDHLGVGAWITGCNLDRGWHDVRVLGRRQAQESQSACNEDDNESTIAEMGQSMKK